MKEIEIIAATADEALQRAAEQLGFPPEQLQMQVLEEKTVGGLFGVLGQKQVRARVCVIDTALPSLESEEALLPPEGQALPSEEREDRATEAVQVLQTVLNLMDLEAEVLLKGETEEEVLLEAVGPDLGIVIGSFGQTLNALQLMTNIIANRGRPVRKRIVLDAEGYRERRRRSLENLALSSARKAKEMNREIVLEDLRAAERRIIHTTLQHDPGVVTFSEGEEPHRRLIISPRDGG